MLRTVWTFLTITLTALLMGTSFGHVLEMPAKLGINATLWMTLQQTLYRAFASVGGAIELGAILSVVVLAVLVRRRRQLLFLAIAACVCLVAAFIVWWSITNPVNVEVLRWTGNTIPADWVRWRARWEYSHAARFIFHAIAFGALLISLPGRNAVTTS